MTHQKSSMWRCSLTQISAEMTKIVIQPVAAGYNYLDSRRGFHLHGCLRSKSTVARSTTEDETVALSYVLYEEGLSIRTLERASATRCSVACP